MMRLLNENEKDDALVALSQITYGENVERKQEVAAAFINRKGQDRWKSQFKPRTSTLAVSQPRPRPKPTLKENNIRQLCPTCIWELSDHDIP